VASRRGSEDNLFPFVDHPGLCRDGLLSARLRASRRRSRTNDPRSLQAPEVFRRCPAPLPSAMPAPGGAGSKVSQQRAVNQDEALE